MKPVVEEGCVTIEQPTKIMKLLSIPKLIHYNELRFQDIIIKTAAIAPPESVPTAYRIFDNICTCKLSVSITHTRLLSLLVKFY